MTEGVVRVEGRLWWTTSELAVVLGLSRFTLLREIRAGELVATRRRARGHYRISCEEAQRYAGRTGVRLLVTESGASGRQLIKRVG